MKLPKQRFEPFFMKVVKLFIDHHNLPKDIPTPSGSMLPHKLFTYIADVMAHSMGEEKRNSILYDLEEYKMDLPFDMR